MIRLPITLIIIFVLSSCLFQETDIMDKEKIISNTLIVSSEDLIRDYRKYSHDDSNILLSEIKLDYKFDQPWGMEFLNDNSIILTEKKGYLSHINIKSKTVHRVKHNIPSIQEGQGGLLDLLYHKDFLYLSFTIKNNQGKTTTAIGRGKFTEPYKELKNFQIIFTALPFINDGKHFGSRLLILNEHLYASIGERGQGSIAQDPQAHPGSIIRINLNGTIPSDNPFSKEKKEWLPEIFQIGVRNPQGMAISPDNQIYISNHGAKGGDFIGMIKEGGNYGWNEIGWGGTNYIGTKIGTGQPFKPEFTTPILTWVPSIAPSDIVFYLGDEFPEWNGNLLITSLKYKMLIKIALKEHKVKTELIILKDKIGRIRDVDINSKGEIFLITDEKNSSIWKLTKTEKLKITENP